MITTLIISVLPANLQECLSRILVLIITSINNNKKKLITKIDTRILKITLKKSYPKEMKTSEH